MPRRELRESAEMVVELDDVRGIGLRVVIGHEDGRVLGRLDAVTVERVDGVRRVVRPSTLKNLWGESVGVMKSPLAGTLDLVDHFLEGETVKHG